MSTLTTFSQVMHGLSQSLLAKKTTLVGTVRANCKELPAEFTKWSRKLHSTIQGYDTDGKGLLLSSKVKQAKIMNVLSTMHCLETDLCQDGSRKPSLILSYNSTKEGWDKVDQMSQLYSTRAGSRIYMVISSFFATNWMLLASTPTLSSSWPTTPSNPGDTFFCS